MSLTTPAPVAPASSRLRPGLYRTRHNGTEYWIEDVTTLSQEYGDGVCETGTTWRVTSQAMFGDPWVGDHHTKREALASIAAL